MKLRKALKRLKTAESFVCKVVDQYARAEPPIRDLLNADLKLHRRLPHIHTHEGENVPRILAVVEGFLKATRYHFCEHEFSSFCLGFQENSLLEFRELKAVVSTLKLVLLEQITERGRKLLNVPASDSCELGVCVQSLREVGQISWKEILEPLILFDQALRQDPVSCYAEMDFESRDLYRRKLAAIAAQSDLTETQVADQALALAREAHDRRYRDPRIARRESHIGYYLVGEGREVLSARVGCKPNLLSKSCATGCAAILMSFSCPGSPSSLALSLPRIYCL